MSSLHPHVDPGISYALEIDGAGSKLRDYPFFTDALHYAFQAVDQGARRVVLIRVEGNAELNFTPLCVMTPPEAS